MPARTTYSPPSSPAMAPMSFKSIAHNLKLQYSNKPQRTSEPRVIRSLAAIAHNDGNGAQIVSTPEEALKQSNVWMRDLDISDQDSSSSPAETQPIHSPPLPPIPAEEEEESQHSHYDSHGTIDAEGHSNDEHIPSTSSKQMSIKSPQFMLEDLPQVPPILQSTNGHFSPLPPPFNPILLSDVPSQEIDRSKVTVTLETCTVTYKTTLDTLISRPSHLASYLLSLFPRERSDSISSSVYSTDSKRDDMSIFRRHLTSQGLLPAPPKNSNIHVFLDRASAPYAHILTYLRSPVSPERTDMLPRAVQLQPMTHTRYDALIELRDEAAFLDLEPLYKLCNEELRHRQTHRFTASPQHMHAHRGHSSIQSMHASVFGLSHSSGTAIGDELATMSQRRHSNSIGSANDQISKSYESESRIEAMRSSRSLPTPMSFHSRSESRSRSRGPTPRTPPVGNYF